MREMTSKFDPLVLLAYANGSRMFGAMVSLARHRRLFCDFGCGWRESLRTYDTSSCAREEEEKCALLLLVARMFMLHGIIYYLSL